MSGRHHHPTVGDVARHHGGVGTARDLEVLVADGRARTWADIDEASARLANGLLENGLRPGAKVAALLPNCGEYVEIMYGIARAGCVIVPLSSRYVAREVSAGIAFAGAEALITTPAFAGVVEEVLADLPGLAEERVFVVDREPRSGRSYFALLEAASTESPEVAVDEDAPFWMPFTSGTTGTPKAAVVSHRALIDHWGIVAREFSVTSRDVMLVAGPFYHSLGFLFGLTALHAGGRLVIHSEFDPARVLATIEELGVTITPMVPTMYTMLLGCDEKDRHDLTSMRAVVSAGSPLLTGTRNGLLELFSGAHLYEFYGSTEMGVATVLRPEDQRRKVRCVGQPVFGAEIRLLDDEGRDVPPGETGEIYKRGLLLGAEYYENPEATAAQYRGDWITSGDLGRFDEERYLYVVDRKKDMVITGGANVFPSEIEEVIAKHPGVLEVAVIGVPDPKWGEALKAIVVRRPGSEVTSGEVLDLCEGSLAGYKKPRSVDFVEEMPKTGAGKILKRELRDRYWQGAEGRV